VQRVQVADHTFKSALEILPPFLSSVESSRHNYINEALEALAGAYAERMVGATLQRQYLESTICKILIQAYRKGSTSTNWPIASSGKWAPLVVTFLRPQMRVENSIAIQAVVSVLEAHSEDAVNDKLMCCLEGSEDEIQFVGSSKKLDLLCSRLMQVLSREKPPSELPQAVIQAVFESQARLFLIPTRELLSSHVLIFRQLTRCCAEQANSFTNFIFRLMNANINPMMSHDGGSRLAPLIIPLLMMDSSEVRGSVVRLIAGDKNASLTFGFAIRSLPSSMVANMWTGVTTVLRALSKFEYHEFFPSWERLLELSLLLAENTYRLEDVPAIQEALADWWRFIRMVLDQAISLHFAKPRFEATVVALLNMFLTLWPALRRDMEAATLRRHSTWLPTLLDWILDARMQILASIWNKALEIVKDVVASIVAKGIRIDGIVVKRLQSVVQSGRLDPSSDAMLRKVIAAVSSAGVAEVSRSHDAIQHSAQSTGPVKADSSVRTQGLVKAASIRKEEPASLNTKPKPKPAAAPPSSSIVCDKPCSAADERMPSPEEFEVFRQLKELTQHNKTHTHQFHRHVLKWRVEDLRSTKERLTSLRPVPNRFRDALHYIEIFEPLLLEECRCALGKDLDDCLSEDTRSRGFGKQQPRLKGNMELELQRLTEAPAEEGDPGAFYTLHFSIRGQAPRGQGSTPSPSDLLLLRPKRKKKRRSLLEEGEVSDDEGDEKQQEADLMALIQQAEEGKLLHCLAIMESDEERDPSRVKGEGDEESLTLHVYLPGEGEEEERRPNALEPHRLRLKTVWVATVIGNITTNLREYIGLQEIQRLRLATKLIRGGKHSNQLELVTAEALKARWKKIEEMLNQGQAMADLTLRARHQDEIDNAIKRLASVRVSAQVLHDSQVGVAMVKVKKEHKEVKETCSMVISTWKKQIELEKACFESPAKASSSTTPSREVPTRPPSVPTELWLALSHRYNPPQLSAIAEACSTLYSPSMVNKGQITLLQGPPGTGKTNTIFGLLSAILSATPHRMPLHPTSGGGVVRPAVRMGGGLRNRSNRILICAPSNGAVDEVLVRLLQPQAGGGLINSKGQAFTPTLVRIGQMNPDAPPEVQSASLENQVKARMSNR